jgi:hypothetical protein
MTDNRPTERGVVDQYYVCLIEREAPDAGWQLYKAGMMCWQYQTQCREKQRKSD